MRWQHLGAQELEVGEHSVLLDCTAGAERQGTASLEAGRRLVPDATQPCRAALITRICSVGGKNAAANELDQIGIFKRQLAAPKRETGKGHEEKQAKQTPSGHGWAEVVMVATRVGAFERVLRERINRT